MKRAARVLTLSVVACAWPLVATAEIYLTVPNVPGDVTDAGHTGTIRAFALDWATTAASSWTSGGGATVAKPNPGSLHLTIASGPWSNMLIQAITTGHVLDGPPTPGPIVIDATANGRPLYRLTLQGVFLTKYEIQLDPQKGPVDGVDVVFKTVSIDRPYVDSKGTALNSNFVWNIPGGTAEATVGTVAPPPQLQQPPPTLTPQLKPRTN
jgi:type VI secretion system secreted protein Hcp